MDWILWMILTIYNVKHHVPLKSFRTEGDCGARLKSVKEDMKEAYPGAEMSFYCEEDEESVDLSHRI